MSEQYQHSHPRHFRTAVMAQYRVVLGLMNSAKVLRHLSNQTHRRSFQFFVCLSHQVGRWLPPWNIAVLPQSKNEVGLILYPREPKEAWPMGTIAPEKDSTQAQAVWMWACTRAWSIHSSTVPTDFDEDCEGGLPEYMVPYLTGN